MNDFAAHGSDPAFAMQIIDAALTDTEIGSDTMATISASATATLPFTAVTAAGMTSAKMMLTMIKQVMLPIAERVVELEGQLA